MISRVNQGRGKCNQPRPDDYTCRDLDYSGNHKTEFSYCFIIQCFIENIQKLLCEMQIQGQRHQAAASLQTIQVLSLDKRCALRTV